MSKQEKTEGSNKLNQALKIVQKLADADFAFEINKIVEKENLSRMEVANIINLVLERAQNMNKTELKKAINLALIKIYIEERTGSS